MEQVDLKHRNNKILTFWVMIIALNVVVGTGIGVTRLSFGDVKGTAQPAFVVLSQQANKAHKELNQKISRVNDRVGRLETRVERLEENEQVPSLKFPAPPKQVSK